MDAYIQQIIEHDQVAFEIVFKLSHKKVYAYFIKKTSSREMADELTQLAFIKMWRFRGSLTANLPVDVQLFRIAKTTLLDYFKKVATEEQNLKSYYRESLSNLYSSSSDYETNQELEAVLSKLPPTRKKVFILSRIEGYSYKEIAELLCISPKTVENHISLALKQLRGYSGAAIIVSLVYSLT